MEQFGRFEFDPVDSRLDAGSVWRNIVEPMMPFAHSDSGAFLRSLAATVLPAGGWAVYGGDHLVEELLSGKLNNPFYHAMMAASLDYLRELGVSKMRLNGYEAAFWNETKGKTEPWLYLQPIPTN
jgi:hypothetical protein